MREARPAEAMMGTVMSGLAAFVSAQQRWLTVPASCSRVFATRASSAHRRGVIAVTRTAIFCLC